MAKPWLLAHGPFKGLQQKPKTPLKAVLRDSQEEESIILLYNHLYPFLPSSPEPPPLTPVPTKTSVCSCLYLPLLHHLVLPYLCLSPPWLFLTSPSFPPPHTCQGVPYGPSDVSSDPNSAVASSVLTLQQPFSDSHYLRVPFFTTGLYNWNNQNPSFSTDSLISLIYLVFFNHFPTWDNCQPFLCTLFTTKEREWIFMRAAEALLD